MTSITTTRESDGTVRAFVDGYEYASAALSATASKRELRNLRSRVRERARRAFQREFQKFGRD